MFAPPVPKQKAKAAEPQHSTVAAQRPSQAGVAQAHLLQRSIGNQAVLRLLAQRASVTRNEPGAQEKEDNTARTAGREAAPSWDFSKIPAFSSGRTNQLRERFPFGVLPLPGAIQAKLKVGAVDDPLEHEADRVADQVMRMPAPGVSAADAPPQVSRKCGACEEEEKLQKKPAGPQAAAGEAPGIVHEVLRSPGQPLDEGNARRLRAALWPGLFRGARAYRFVGRTIGARRKRQCLYGGTQHCLWCGPVRTEDARGTALACP